MSPDLEQLLRDARKTLPEPEAGVTARARARIVGSARGVRRRAARGLAVIALTTVATAVGFGFGLRVGPEQVQAAQPSGVFGAGFLPADGWSTFQRGRPQGAAAVAANVPLLGEDLASENVVPLATLARLPERGAVIVAVLEPRGGSVAAARTLPLRLAGAEPEVREIGGRTLLVRRLRARVAAFALDVSVFFGAERPSAAVVLQAQRQLERLVVEAPKVTIRAELRVTPGQSWRRWVDVEGTIASSAANELVEVHARECGRGGFYHLVGTARSLPGGSWKLLTYENGVIVPRIPVNAYFRARWDGTFSEPALVRIPLFVSAVFIPRQRRVLVLMNTRETGHNLAGKVVELQRKVPGTEQWVRVRTARLRRFLPVRVHGPDSFRTEFRVPTRGLTLRVFAPAAIGAPCYSAGASEPFKS